MRKTLLLFFLLESFSGRSQVNLQTGSATFNLPMFNWEDNKSRLASSISLNYFSGNGLIVDEVASNVGQGWALNAGGVIIRQQIGEPDDQYPNDGNGSIEDINKYPAGFLYNPVNANLGCPTALGYFPIFTNQNHLYKQHNSLNADRQQDYFTAQFNGRSIKFVLGKNNNNKGIPVGDSRVKLWYDLSPTLSQSQHIRTAITSFYIQDENGLIYTFDKLGLTKILKIEPTFPGINNYPSPQPIYQDQLKYFQATFDEIPLSGNPFIVNSWYLSTIYDPSAQRTISFNYDVRDLNNYAGNEITDIRTFENTSGGSLPSKEYIMVTEQRSINQTPAIKSISYPDGHNVTFTYDIANPRFDLEGGFALKSVDIEYDNRYVSRFQLNTTYFILNHLGFPKSLDEKKASRLCLKSVTKFGVDLKENEQPYIFDYYMGSNNTEDFVPPPYYYAKDIWGYYNGTNVNNIRTPSPGIPMIVTGLYNMSAILVNSLSFIQAKTLCFLSNNSSNGVITSFNTIKNGFAKNGLLKSITYPTKSILNYEYEQNIYNAISGPNSVTQGNIADNIYRGGIHVSKTSVSDGGYSNGDTNPLQSSYKYVNNDGITTSQWSEYPNNSESFNHSFFLEGSHHNFFTNTCSYDYQYPGITSKDASFSTSDDIENKQILANVIGAASLGYSVASTVSTLLKSVITTIDYASVALAIYDFCVKVLTYIFTSCDDTGRHGTTILRHNSNIFSVNAYPTMFSRVEVISNDDERYNGKVVYEFTDLKDYPLWISQDQNFPFQYAHQRFAPWAYGLNKKTTIYDNNGSKVKEVENVYNWNDYNVKSVASPDFSCQCEVTDQLSMRNDSWAPFSSQQNLNYTTNIFEANGPTGFRSVRINPVIYNLFTGRVELTDSYERLFSTSNQLKFVETATHYDYNYENLQVNKVTKTNDKGDKLINTTYYPTDYTTTGILSTLKSRNIINIPVANYSMILQDELGSNPVLYYLGATVNDFATTSSGNIVRSRELVGNSRLPVNGYFVDPRYPQNYPPFNYPPIVGYNFDPGNPFNYPNLKVNKSFTYNSFGTLSGVKDKGDRIMTYLYDYNEKFIVATIINADPDLDKPAYTSFETNNLGNWHLSNNPNFNTTYAVTGSRSLMLSSNDNITATINNSTKSYVVSFWADNNSITINGDIPIVKGNLKNGFSYYEYNVPVGVANIIIQGSANIDELRLYPQNARMQTVTYDPLIGKTSECDGNNRLVYYEYDNLSRLRFIKDENMNIVKMYEYNTKENGSVTTSTVVNYSGVIYAKIFYENTYLNQNDDTYGDVVLRFFSNEACTTPVYIENLSVKIGNTADCGANSGNSVDLFRMVNASGFSFILDTNTPLSQHMFTQDNGGVDIPIVCNYTTYLVPYFGYKIE